MPRLEQNDLLLEGGAESVVADQGGAAVQADDIVTVTYRCEQAGRFRQ